MCGLQCDHELHFYSSSTGYATHFCLNITEAYEFAKGRAKLPRGNHKDSKLTISLNFWYVHRLTHSKQKNHAPKCVVNFHEQLTSSLPSFPSSCPSCPPSCCCTNFSLITSKKTEGRWFCPTGASQFCLTS